MKKKNKLLSLAMVFIFAVTFLVPSLSMPATALADPDVDSGYIAGDLNLVTGDADDVEDDEATLWASVDVDEDDADDEIYDIYEYGFFYGTDEDELDEVEDLLEDGDDGWSCNYLEGDEIDYDDDDEAYEFSLVLSDLDEDEETYYYRAYIEYYDEDEDETYYALGDVDEFDVDEGTSHEKPDVTSGSATEIKINSAVLNGTVDSFGGYDEITEYGFYYGTSSSPTTKKKVGDDDDNIDEGDDFDYSLTGLKADTKYYFKAYAKNDEGTAYGSIKSFTTKKSAVNTTPSVFTIGSNFYMLHGSSQLMEAAPYIKNNRTYLPIRYVGYAMGLTDSQIQWNPATQSAILTNGKTTVVLIIGNKTMFVNGIATTADVAPEITNNRTCLPIAWVASAFGTTAVWNPTLRTVTIPAVVTQSPETGQVEVTTKSASSIGSDYATLNGEITDNGGLDISEYGFYYGTSKTEVADGEDGDADVDEADGDEGDFYLELDDLDTDETYYFMAYAIDENDDITYGSVKSFTTKDSYDKPSVTTLSATEIDDESAVLNGRITSFGDDDEITEYGFYYGTSSSPTTRKKVGDDSDNIDEGDDFDYTLTGLKADTKYYFKAYAKNSEGIAYGSVKSFITD